MPTPLVGDTKKEKKLIRHMRMVRDDMKKVYGSKYPAIIGDYIEMIQGEQARQGVNAERAAMILIGKVNYKYANGGMVKGAITAALIDGLEEGKFHE